MTVEQLVAESIALLDKKGPKHWRERVAARGPMTLESLCDSSDCVLGRIYGDYETGCRRLGIPAYFFASDAFCPVLNWGAVAEEWNRQLAPAEVAA